MIRIRTHTRKPAVVLGGLSSYVIRDLLSANFPADIAICYLRRSMSFSGCFSWIHIGIATG